MRTWLRKGLEGFKRISLPGTRRAWWTGIAATAAVLAGGVFLGAGPLIRRVAIDRAEERGIDLKIDAVRLGWGRVWLRGVEGQLDGVSGLEVSLESVAVDLSWLLSPRRIAGRGGTLRVSGTDEELIEELRAWRERRPKKGASGHSRSSMAVSVEGLFVEWIGSRHGSQRFWGLSYERRMDGGEHIGADLAELRTRGAALRAKNIDLGLVRGSKGRIVETLSAKDVMVELDLVGLTRSLGTTEPRAAPQPTARAASFFPVDSGERAARLRHGVRVFSQLAASWLREGGKLELSGLRARLHREDDVLNLGPSRFSITRLGDRVEVGFVPGEQAQAEGVPLSFEVALPLSQGTVRARLRGGPIRLSALGIQEGDFGLRELSRARIAAEGDLVFGPADDVVEVEGRVELSDLTLEKASLAPRPVSIGRLTWSGKGRLSLDGRKVSVDDARLIVGEAKLLTQGELTRGEEDAKLEFSAEVPIAACQTLLSSVPRGMAPLLDGMTMKGTFSAKLELSFDTSQLSKTAVNLRMQNECKIASVAAGISPARFRSRWTREVRDASGEPMLIESGPGSSDWVPYEDISRHMETAVLVCEDGRFFRHRGFDPEAIANSLRDNIKAERFLRGGSTISMQLAKNLYLHRDKTLARKLQEAFLTMLLEQELDKQALMELYLNVIEFGPGIYGIGPAARATFETEPGDLSLGQALYLASILPNPRQRHFAEDGKVTERWSEYLRKLMRIAHRIRRISDEELEFALSEQVVYGEPSAPVEGPSELIRDDAFFGEPGPTEPSSWPWESLYEN